MLDKLVSLALLVLYIRSLKAEQSCTETSCYNEADCVDGMCVCAIGFHPPVCQECSSIDDCEVKNCTNESDQVCVKCEGDYGHDGAAYLPSMDGTSCIEQCSWRDGKTCFPGTCDNGLESCDCFDGFHDQTCLGTYLQPDLYDFIGVLTDGQRNITTSSNADITTFTNEHFPKQFTISWTSEFNKPNVDIPPYVLRWYFGIATVEAQVNIVQKDGSITEQVARPTCSTPVSIDFPVRLHACEETIHLSLEDHQIETGDKIRAVVRVSTGGNRVIINLDAEDETRETYRTDYYQNTGGRIVDDVMFTFDLEDPYHCITSSECQSTMLHLEKDVTTKNDTLVRWSDWVDDFSGIDEFILRLYRIEKQGSTLAEVKEESELKFTTNSETEVLLTDPGLYSLILEVRDMAMNIKLARRFVLFDNMNPPQIRSEFPMVVRSASGDEIDWLVVIENVTIQLDWSDRFWSRFVHENSLLNEIDEYIGVAVEYDQVSGTRGRPSIDNVMGIIQFEIISTITRGGSIMNQQDFNVHLNTTYVFTYNAVPIQNGDQLEFLVRASDIFNRTVEDILSITVESTAPEITNVSVNQNGRSFKPTGNTDVSSQDLLSVQVSVEEHESRLTDITWTLITWHVLSTDPIEIEKEITTVDEYCATEPILCVRDGIYESLIYELPLDFSQVQSQEGQLYSVEIVFSNEAQLTKKAEFQFLVKATPKYFSTVKTYATPMSSTATDKSSKTTNDVGIDVKQNSSTGAAIGGGIGGTLLILLISLIVILLIFRRQKAKRSNDRLNNIYDVPDRLVPMNNENCTPSGASNEKNTNVIYDNHIQRVRLNSYDNRLALKNTYESTIDLPKGATGNIDLNYEEPMDDSIEFPRENLVIGDQIGEGAFGNVTRARAFHIRGQKQWTVVAVKSLKDVNKKPEFTRELQTLRKLPPHPNLVTLLGICSHEDPFYLIFEYASHGDLKSFLQAQQSNIEGGNPLYGLTPRDLINFANGIAKGMAFLASQKVIHRDLAARNVLVGEDANGKKLCKISDFGLSRDLLTKAQHRQSIHTVGLPVRWMAYESLFEGVYTSMSDVWSFGIVVWEIVTLGARPYSEMNSRQVMTELQAGNRLEQPNHCSDYLYNVMLDCWQEHPRKRPTFNELVDKLDPDLESIVLQFDIFDSRRYSCYTSDAIESLNSSTEKGESYYVNMNG